MSLHPVDDSGQRNQASICLSNQAPLVGLGMGWLQSKSGSNMEGRRGHGCWEQFMVVSTINTKIERRGDTWKVPSMCLSMTADHFNNKQRHKQSSLCSFETCPRHSTVLMLWRSGNSAASSQRKGPSCFAHFATAFRLLHFIASALPTVSAYCELAS